MFRPASRLCKAWAFLHDEAVWIQIFCLRFFFSIKYDHCHWLISSTSIVNFSKYKKYCEVRNEYINCVKAFHAHSLTVQGQISIVLLFYTTLYSHYLRAGWEFKVHAIWTNYSTMQILTCSVLLISLLQVEEQVKMSLNTINNYPLWPPPLSLLLALISVMISINPLYRWTVTVKIHYKNKGSSINYDVSFVFFSFVACMTQSRH